jgi:hypothetical protein
MLAYFLNLKQLLALSRTSRHIFNAIANERPFCTSVQAYHQFVYVLMPACAANRLDIIEYLQQNFEHSFESVLLCFLRATNLGFLEIVQFLYRHYYRFYECYHMQRALKFAQQEGHVCVAEWLESQFRQRFQCSNARCNSLSFRYYLWQIRSSDDKGIEMLYECKDCGCPMVETKIDPLLLS